MTEDLLRKWARVITENGGNFVLAVVANKGGVGKTTFAYNLLYLLTKLKISAALIDCDNDQYSSAEFAADRKAIGVLPDLIVYNMETAELQQNILELSKKHKILIIEFGKATGNKEEKDRNKALELAIKLADTIVMPLQPTPPDAKTISKVEAKLPLSANNVPTIIVPNRVKTIGQLGALTSAELKLKYFKISKSFIKDRLCYQDSLYTGRSVFEMKGKEPEKAQEELIKLFIEILCQDLH